MIVRAGVLDRVGGELELAELELAPPRPREVLVRLQALMDGATRLSCDGEPVYHYSFLSTFAEACFVPERCCVPTRATSPSRSRASWAAR